MKRILHVIPHKNLYPPLNGGNLRCFHLMDQLSRFFTMDVLCYQGKEEFEDRGYLNKNINFYGPESYPVNRLWKLLPVKLRNAIRYRLIRRSLSGPAGAVVLDFAHVIQHLATKHQYDCVVFEHLSSMKLAPIVKRLMPNAKTIIDAHNIDSKLTNSEAIKGTEKHLYKEVNSFWGCSREDVNKLEEMNRHRIIGTVVPNGVDAQAKPFVREKKGLETKLLFCGTLSYYPNKEGLLWFYREIWPLITYRLEDIQLTIIGRGDTKPFEHFKSDDRIQLVGEVDEVGPYYQESYLSIVPLLSGSGTRLKILEAMSFGNPVISTSLGIEGIEASHRKEAIVADKADDFANAIIEVVLNSSIGEELRKNAHNLVMTRYDWRVIGEQLSKHLTTNAKV